VEFVNGDTYLANGDFYVYSNTDILLNGSTVKEGTKAVRFLNNFASLTHVGYGAIVNFNVYNGTFVGQTNGVEFGLLHAQNCRFEGINFNDSFIQTHVFDLGGCQNIVIKNCNFIGNKHVDPSTSYREVIQPDYATYQALPYWGNDESYAFDAIATDNLLVENCVFKKNDGDTYYLNGVGTHAANTTPHTNITVRRCEFYDCDYSCIRLPKATNVIIEENTLYNIRSDRTSDNLAINIYNDGDSGIMALHDIVIRNNKFISTGSTTDQIFIRVSGRTDYLTSNILIEGNVYYGKSTNEGDYLGNDFSHIQNVDKVVFRGNIINNTKAVLYAADKPVNNLKVVNNVFNNCLRGVRSSSSYADPTSNVFSEGFVWANNTWTNPIGAVDTSGARVVVGLENDLVLTDTSASNTWLPTVVKEGLPLYTTDGNNDIFIPSYFKKFRVSGVVKLQTESGSTLHHIRIQKYERQSSTSTNTDYVYGIDTAGAPRSLDIGEISVDDSNLAWPYFGTDANHLWKDGHLIVKVGVNTTGNVTVLADGTYIIIEAF